MATTPHAVDLDAATAAAEPALTVILTVPGFTAFSVTVAGASAQLSVVAGSVPQRNETTSLEPPNGIAPIIDVPACRLPADSSEPGVEASVRSPS